MSEQPPLDTLLFLAAPDVLGSKTHTPAGTSDYNSPVGPFSCSRVHVENLADLADALAQCPFNAFHVRGATLPPAASHIPYRRTHARPGEPPSLQEHAHHTIPVDFDSPNDAAVPMTDLYESATYVRELLPPPFNTAACIAQATSNAGIKPGARVRLWYFANRPVADRELKDYFKHAPVDTSIYGAHQPIYVASPRFIGVADPFPRRFCVLPGPDLELPELLIHHVPDTHTPAGATTGAIATALQGISGNVVEGNRNATMTSIAGTMRRRGLEPAAILAALVSHNETNVVPPLPLQELEQIATSISHYEPTGVPVLVPRSSKSAERALKRHTQRVFEDPGLLNSALLELKSLVVQGLLTETQISTRMCEALKKEGTIVTDQQIVAQLRSTPIAATQEQAAWQADLLRNDEGSIRISPFNMHLILRKCPDIEVWYDTRSDEVQWARAPWINGPRLLQDTDDPAMREWFDKAFGWARVPGEPFPAVRLVARDRPWDPWTDGYLNRLQWDGTPRLASAAHTLLGAESPRECMCFAWWMISSVARSYQPGCQVDYMIVLESLQGRQKSSFLQALVGASRYYSRIATTGDLNAPRVTAKLQGPVIIEVAELSALSKRDVEQTKEFLDNREDKWIPLHGRTQRVSPRRVVFAGTTNNSDYLRDPTGARRYWPIKVNGRCDLVQLELVRDQLWAEAVHAYNSGIKWWPTPDEEEMLGMAAANEERREFEQGEEALHQLLGKPHVPGQAFGGPAPEQWQLDHRNMLVRATLLWFQGYLSGVDQRSIAKALTAAGWTRTRMRVGGQLQRIWFAPGNKPAEGGL